MSNLYDDDYNEDKSYSKMVASCILGASIVVLIFLIILVMNNQKKIERQKELRLEQELIEAQEELEKQEEAKIDAELDVGHHNFTSQDLDFWDMYDVDKKKVSSDGEGNKKKDKVDDLDDKSLDKDMESSEEGNEDDNQDEDEGDSDIGSEEKYDESKYISVKDSDGEVMYYEIMDDVAKNDYDFDKNGLYENDRVKYSGSSYTVQNGIDISKYQGNVDFAKVKNSGIDFVMLRVAFRGNTTGQIALDDNFVINANGAKAVGLPIGAYFYTQALSENEAIEEANFAVAAIGNFGVTYPVAIDVEFSKSAGDRASKLSVEDRTSYVKKFLEVVKSFGYKPMIYASKEMLVSGLDLSELEEYDIWISDSVRKDQLQKESTIKAEDVRKMTEEEVKQHSASWYTNYPYNFSMWQYNTEGKIDGIAGNVDLDAYFIKKE